MSDLLTYQKIDMSFSVNILPKIPHLYIIYTALSFMDFGRAGARPGSHHVTSIKIWNKPTQKIHVILPDRAE